MRWSKTNKLYLPPVPSIEGVRNPSAAAAAAANAFEDNFDESIQIKLEDHTADTGHTWTGRSVAPSGEVLWVTTGGAAKDIQARNTPIASYYSSYAQADVLVEAEITVITYSSLQNYSLQVRGTASPTTNTWYQGGIVGNVLQIYRVVAGTFTLLVQDASTDYSGLTTFVLELEIQGTTLKARVDGAGEISATDSNIASGNVGIWHRRGLSPSGDGQYNYIIANPL